jgi:hypothetical protein
MCVFGLESLNFITERISIWHKNFKMQFFDQYQKIALSKKQKKLMHFLPNFKQASKQKRVLGCFLQI